MKTIKYYLILLLSVLCSTSPIIGFLFFYFYKDTSDRILGILIGIGIAGIGMMLKKPVDAMRVEARQSVEYDEFGRSKTKGKYEYLSKAERNVIDLQRTADMERLVDTTAIRKMTKQGSIHPQQDLDRMIGLKPVKHKISEMVARMEFEKKNKRSKQSLSMTSRHMVFYGSPGTGKTTVARIITGFLYQNGYIKENKCIEVDGNYLKAGPDTATKTELIVREAFGGILFIDEAYVLMESGDGSGKQAVATLIKQMEDNRDRFILIMAGYTKEMKRLLECNPGFQSRIKEYLDFPDYDAYEMRQIFMLMAGEQNMTISDGAYEVFDERVQKERTLKSFGNGRTVRNILDETLDHHALNYMEQKIEKNKKYIICPEDISPNPKRI